MKAIAIDDVGVLGVLDGFEMPALPSGHVLVRMLAGGVCGSDLSGLDRDLGHAGRARILGHEGGGEVVRVADDVTSHAAGDLVVIEPNYSCLDCEWCRQGQTKMCPNRVVVGLHTPGIFAEYTAIPAPYAWKLPLDVPSAVLATFEPAVVARTAVQQMEIQDIENVLVIGAGSQGQSVIKSLLDRGIKPAVAEPNEARLQRAVQLGARDASDGEAEQFTVVFETSGVGAAVGTALDRAEKLARVCLIGQSEAPVPVITRRIVQKELTIRGSVIYNHPADFGSAVHELKAGRFDPAVGLRAPVGPREATGDLQRARSLDGKIWIDFTDWTR